MNLVVQEHAGNIRERVENIIACWGAFQVALYRNYVKLWRRNISTDSGDESEFRKNNPNESWLLSWAMSDIKHILDELESGDPSAAELLLPLVYDELRKLAAARLAQEKPGQTLQATALVHDAYLRLVDVEQAQRWNSRGHFFAAAAEAMRRILVDNAKRKMSARHGGQAERQELDENQIVAPSSGIDLIALDEVLNALAIHDARKAELVKLRYFAGLTGREAAEVLGISESTADADWAYARSWLRVHLVQ